MVTLFNIQKWFHTILTPRLNVTGDEPDQTSKKASILRWNWILNVDLSWNWILTKVDVATSTTGHNSSAADSTIFYQQTKYVFRCPGPSVPTFVSCPDRSIPLPTLADWLTDWVSCTVEFDTKSDFWDFKHLTICLDRLTKRQTQQRESLVLLCQGSLSLLFLDNDKYVSRQW